MSPAPVAIQSTRRYRLASPDGRWLHFSCTKLVEEKHYSWVGTVAQLAAVRRAFPLAAELRAIRELPGPGAPV